MAKQVGFRRNMGLFMAIMIGIGATMGPGIFALPGELAHMIGPLGIVVYLAMGFLTLFTALNYSELSAAIPLAWQPQMTQRIRSRASSERIIETRAASGSPSINWHRARSWLSQIVARSCTWT